MTAEARHACPHRFSHVNGIRECLKLANVLTYSHFSRRGAGDGQLGNPVVKNAVLLWSGAVVDSPRRRRVSPKYVHADRQQGDRMGHRIRAADGGRQLIPGAWGCGETAFYHGGSSRGPLRATERMCCVAGPRPPRSTRPPWPSVALDCFLRGKNALLLWSGAVAHSPRRRRVSPQRVHADRQQGDGMAHRTGTGDGGGQSIPGAYHVNRLGSGLQTGQRTDV